MHTGESNIIRGTKCWDGGMGMGDGPELVHAQLLAS